MTRLEQENVNNSPVEDLESEVEKLKKQLKRKQNKKVFGCWGCLSLMVLLLLFCALGVAYVLAKSGLKQIPILTPALYKEPQPIYLVQTKNLKKEDLDVLAILKNNAMKAASLQKNTDKLDIKLQLSEAQLTGIARQSLESNPDLAKKIQFLQIAVLKDDLQLFVKTEGNLYFVMQLKPLVADGKLKLDCKSIKVGNLDLPGFVKNFTVGYVIENTLNQSLEAFLQFGKLTSIELTPGAATFNISITNIKALL